MLAIRAARLFDGSAWRNDALVLVDGERIVDVSGAPPPHAELLDLGDATLVPGLIDAHVHLGLNASPDPVAHLGEVDDGALLAEMRAAAGRALRAGITTVRDLGDRSYLGVRLRDELRGHPGLGPSILAAGPPVTTRRGHCWFLGGEVDGSTEAVRATVREHAERGVDVIKVMATGGELTPGTRPHQAQFSLEELVVATEEAHRLGLPIIAHAHGREGIERAVQAGCDGVEHASFLTVDDLEVDPAVVDALAAAGTAVCWTAGVAVGEPPLPSRLAHLAQKGIAAVRLLAERGARLVLASDAGISPPKPHDVLPAGLSLLATAALGNAAALAGVTVLAAQACGVSDRKGRLAPGYDADLLAVDGDPLADLAALARPVAVLHQGVWVRCRGDHQTAAADRPAAVRTVLADGHRCGTPAPSASRTTSIPMTLARTAPSGTKTPGGRSPGQDSSTPLEEALRVAVPAASVPCPDPHDHGASQRPGRYARWGNQLDVRPIDLREGKGLTAEAVAAYIAKYATKSTDPLGRLDRRIRSAEELAGLPVREHLARLVTTAWRLGGRSEFAGLGLRQRAHALGFRGHWSSKSRAYSTTYTVLRRARREHTRRQRSGGTEPLDAWGRPEDDDQVLVIATWRCVGVGYRDSTETALALASATWAREQRKTAREQRRTAHPS